MRVPVVVPTLEAIYGKDFLEHFNTHFIGMSIENAFIQVEKDAKAKGVEIKFTNMALYGPLKTLGYSFKKKGRMGMKKGSPIFDKFVQKLGGLDATKDYLSKMVLAGYSIKKALDEINEKTKENFSYSNLVCFAEKLHMEFSAGAKGTHLRGKEPVIYNKFKNSFKDEEAIKAYLRSLSPLTLEEATKTINKKTGEDFSKSNIYSFFKKFNIEFKKLKNRKPKTTDVKEHTDVPQIHGEVTMEKEEITKDPVKVFYKCSSCDHAKGMQKPYLTLPLGLKGMRCGQCGKWGTYVATAIENGKTRRFAVVNLEGFDASIKISSEA